MAHPNNPDEAIWPIPASWPADLRMRKLSARQIDTLRRLVADPLVWLSIHGTMRGSLLNQGYVTMTPDNSLGFTKKTYDLLELHRHPASKSGQPKGKLRGSETRDPIGPALSLDREFAAIRARRMAVPSTSLADEWDSLRERWESIKVA